MTYQLRGWGRRPVGAAGALAATLATVATVAGAMAPTNTPAWADSVTVTTTTSTSAPTTPSSIPTTSTTTSTSTTPTTLAPAAVATLSSPAHADRLARIEADSAHLISNRLTSLAAAITAVQKVPFLGTDGAALVTGMQADIAGLQALGSTIAADATVQQAAHDRGLIFNQFRVYLLVLPVVHEVVQTDRVVNVELPAVQDAVTKLQGLENSSNQAVLGPVITGIQKQGQIATAATAGLSAQLMAYTPAQWDADHKVLFGLGADIRTADQALRTADREVKQSDRYLRGAKLGRHGHGAGAPTTSTTATTSTTSTPNTVSAS